MRTVFRFLILCIGGFLLVVVALSLRDERNPHTAPPEVQNSGRSMLREQLLAMEKSEFVKSTRGRILFQRVGTFLAQDKIVFTSEIIGNEKAYSKNDLIGGEKWYIEVKRTENGNYSHLSPSELVEVAFHEAVHSIKGGFAASSIEEECDAFVAGQQAEAACQGIAPADVVMLEDVPVAQFVKRSYKGIVHKPDYEPVAESMEWLKKRSGL